MILYGFVQKEHTAQTVKEAEACGLACRSYDQGHLVRKKPGEPDNGMVELQLTGSPDQIRAFHATYPFTGPVKGIGPLTLSDGDEPLYLY